MKFVLASFNPDKLRELREVLSLPGLELVGWAEFPGAAAPVETGNTVEENARAKARAALRHTGLPAIADDTGLEVDALGGRPGVRAARFAGEAGSYANNLQLLLRALDGVEPGRRTARFRTACVVCFPDGTERVAEGVLEGRITEAARGTGGFGYDPVFEVRGLGRTLAELAEDEKNALSHRALAARELARQLGSCLR